MWQIFKSYEEELLGKFCMDKKLKFRKNRQVYNGEND